jgi:hypothetical protein
MATFAEYKKEKKSGKGEDGGPPKAPRAAPVPSAAPKEAALSGAPLHLVCVCQHWLLLAPITMLLLLHAPCTCNRPLSSGDQLVADFVKKYLAPHVKSGDITKDDYVKIKEK